jgi:hypothetical protein
LKKPWNSWNKPISNDIWYFEVKDTSLSSCETSKIISVFKNRFRICDGKLDVEQVKY